MFSDILKIMANSDSDMSKYVLILAVTIYTLSNTNLLEKITNPIVDIPKMDIIPPRSCSIAPLLIIGLIFGYMVYNLGNMILNIFLNNDGFNEIGDIDNLNNLNNIKRILFKNKCRRMGGCPFGFGICKVMDNNNDNDNNNNNNNNNNNTKSSGVKKTLETPDAPETIETTEPESQINETRKVFKEKLQSELTDYLENKDDFVNIDKKED